MIFRPTLNDFGGRSLSAILSSLLLSLSGAVAAQTAAPPPDLSPAQASRPRSQPVPEALKLLGPKAKFLKDGVLVVATTVGVLPFGDYATDNKTLVGNAPDIAQLIADALGRKLELISVAWADWPLGLQSGKYDLVVSNVTVTEERKEKFDFSTYRNDQLGVYVKSDSKIKSIKDAKDLAGLRVIVASATNQEQILLRWNQQNVAAGLKPVEFQSYDDPVVLRLALQSGRADAHFAPNGWAAFEARDGKTRLVGTFPGGYPLTAEIAAASRKGSGLAEAVTAALNAQIKNGNYAKALSRWSLESEAITESRTNPPGLPKK